MWKIGFAEIFKMKIKNIEKINQISSGWKPSDMAFIKKLNWSADSLHITFLSQSKGTAEIWPDLYTPFVEVLITFDKVSNLKLNFSGNGIHQITGFDLIDVSENGWEFIKFQVEDYEADTISFNCMDACITSVAYPVQFEEIS